MKRLNLTPGCLKYKCLPELGVQQRKSSRPLGLTVRRDGLLVTELECKAVEIIYLG